MKKLVLLFLMLMLASPAFAELFSVAHLRVDGEDVIIIPLVARDIVDMTKAEKEAVYQAFSECAHNKRNHLKGKVMMTWSAHESFRYYGHKDWLEYMSSKNTKWVQSKLNKSIYCE